MNLVEKLLKIDKAEFEKIETKEIASKSLAKLFRSGRRCKSESKSDRRRSFRRAFSDRT